MRALQITLGILAGAMACNGTNDQLSGTHVPVPIELSPADPIIQVGASLQFKAKFNGIDSGPWTWSTTDTTIATVNNSGVLTGKRLGRTNVTVTYQGASGLTTVTIVQ